MSGAAKADGAPRTTESLAGGRDHEAVAGVQAFRLRVVAGDGAGKQFDSTSERVVVGSDPSADFVLSDPAVSRFHCELFVTPAGLEIKDLGSMNGTIVDGVTVLHARVRDGAMLALGRTQLRCDASPDQARVTLSTRGTFGLAVGRSFAMARAFAVLERAAPSDSTVLLEGETGTGKELVAESIHRESPRRDKPFVVVDCSAIPRDLLESELFGHTRGAFTGAVAAREGAIEAADGGTLFLDEIGELDAELQPKLLRALERREVKRVGETAYRPVDVRLVAATNKNLRAEVNAKRFRPDLYYRLAVVEVRLPPLRERIEDIPLLVEHTLASLKAQMHPQAAVLRAPDFLAELARHAWPGNVRELRNYLERCLTLAERAPLVADPETSAFIVDPSKPLKTARDACLAAFERRYVAELLERHQGNITAAARAAAVDRITFYRLLWRHGLK
jgi:transcriptional regulator with PAS, ATPase and Fis domain